MSVSREIYQEMRQRQIMRDQFSIRDFAFERTIHVHPSPVDAVVPHAPVDVVTTFPPCQNLAKVA
jgi:hypothetical protein